MTVITRQDTLQALRAFVKQEPSSRNLDLFFFMHDFLKLSYDSIARQFPDVARSFDDHMELMNQQYHMAQMEDS